MKRLRRWLFDLTAGVSLLVAVTIVVLWLRTDSRNVSMGGMLSSVAGDAFTCEYRFGRFSINSSSESLFVGHVNIGHRVNRYSVNPTSSRNSPWDPWFTKSAWNRWGFGYRMEDLIPGQTAGAGKIYPAILKIRMIVVPHWFGVLLFLLLPLTWLVKRGFRRSHLNANGCAVCGYDLRATPYRCPECGTEVHANPAPLPSVEEAT